jgi:hypothetical protein
MEFARGLTGIRPAGLLRLLEAEQAHDPIDVDRE